MVLVKNETIPGPLNLVFLKINITNNLQVQGQRVKTEKY